MKKFLAAIAATCLFFGPAAARQRDEHQHAPTTATFTVTVVSKASKPVEGLEVRTLKPAAACRVGAHGECELAVGRGKQVTLRVYDAKGNLLGSETFDSSKDGDRKVTVQIP